MGTTDKHIRVVIAATIGVLYILDYISRTFAYVLMVIAIELLFTSLVNFCHFTAGSESVLEKLNLNDLRA